MTDKFGLLNQFSQRLNYLGQRQSVLAENVANADTPGYAPRDLNPKDFERLVRGQAPQVRTTVTQAGHLVGTLHDQGPFDSREQRDRYETSPSGNAVVIEEQLGKVAETKLQYSTVSNLYGKYMAMFRTALGRSQ